MLCDELVLVRKCLVLVQTFGGLSISIPFVSWDFHIQQYLEFAVNCSAVNCISVDTNALLIREVNRQWADWFELTKRL